jgi:hypothetical protein
MENIINYWSVYICITTGHIKQTLQQSYMLMKCCLPLRKHKLQASEKKELWKIFTLQIEE